MFNVGDAVTVRQNFWKVTPHEGLSVAPAMVDMAGNTLTITKTEHIGVKEWYKVKENVYTWDENWIDPVEESTVTDIDPEKFARMFE